jgi:hypothetical protein
MQTAHIPQRSALDQDNKIVCPEGCSIWAGKASRPWWIHSGGISTCVVCVLYEFNSPSPQVFFFHFIASRAALARDFRDNLPARVTGNPGLFRARIYSNPQARSEASLTRIQRIRTAVAGVNSITELDTAGGFNVRLSDGTFTDGAAGSGAMGHLMNPAIAVTEFCCMQELGGVEVPKTLPNGW